MNAEYDDNYSNHVSVYPCISTFLIAMFYLGVLNLILNLGVPTGEDVDDVNPEALLVETDRSLLMYLSPGKRLRKSRFGLDGETFDQKEAGSAIQMTETDSPST